jgi:putative flippase GtrA
MLRTASADGTRGALLRFVLVGATNTLTSGLLVVLAAEWIDIELAYTIIFMLGLTVMTVVSGRFVFRSRLSARSVVRFVSWYLCVYLIGSAIIQLADSDLHVSHVLTTCAVLTITVPLNFLGGHRAFGATPKPKALAASECGCECGEERVHAEATTAEPTVLT